MNEIKNGLLRNKITNTIYWRTIGKKETWPSKPRTKPLIKPRLKIRVFSFFSLSLQFCEELKKNFEGESFRRKVKIICKGSLKKIYVSGLWNFFCKYGQRNNFGRRIKLLLTKLRRTLTFSLLFLLKLLFKKTKTCF